MDQQELRSKNRRVALGVLVGMALLAVLSTGYALATMSYRRQVDLVQPDPRPLKQDLFVVMGLTVIAIGGAFVVYRMRNQKAK